MSESSFSNLKFNKFLPNLVKVTGRFRNNIIKGFPLILVEFGKKNFKIWFKEFTVSDIYIAQIKICAINHLEKGEKEVKNYFEYTVKY